MEARLILCPPNVGGSLRDRIPHSPKPSSPSRRTQGPTLPPSPQCRPRRHIASGIVRIDLRKFLPGSLLRIRFFQASYACRHSVMLEYARLLSNTPSASITLMISAFVYAIAVLFSPRRVAECCRISPAVSKHELCFFGGRDLERSLDFSMANLPRATCSAPRSMSAKCHKRTSGSLHPTIEKVQTRVFLLLSIIRRFEPDKSVVTTCAHCGVDCGFRAETYEGRVVRMIPWKEGKANHGHSCIKGRFAFDYSATSSRPMPLSGARRAFEVICEPIRTRACGPIFSTTSRLAVTASNPSSWKAPCS